MVISQLKVNINGIIKAISFLILDPIITLLIIFISTEFNTLKLRNLNNIKYNYIYTECFISF